MTRNDYINALKEHGWQNEDFEAQEYTTNELKNILEDIEDASDMHPNETDEEFFEHENFDN